MGEFHGKQSAETQRLCGRCHVRPRVSAKRRYCRECFAAAQKASMKRKAEDWAKLRKIVLKRTNHCQLQEDKGRASQ